MTLATQTLRFSATYTFVPAGANATVAEIIAAVNAMLVAEASLGASWGVSNYVAGADNTLEIKRITTVGSPDNTIKAVRGLIFGGTNAPNAGAMALGVTASANALFCGQAETAGLSQAGPDASYTAGSPYTTATSKKYAGGGVWGNNTGIVKTASPIVFMLDCDRFCIICVSDVNGTYFCGFGGIVERLYDNAEIFACMTSGNNPIVTTTYAAMTAASNGFHLNGQDALVSPAGVGCTTWHDGTAARFLARFVATGSTSDALYSVTPSPRGTLVPIAVNDRLQGSTVAQEFGIMRQMRFGPYGRNKTRVDDATPTPQCYLISSGFGVDRAGIWFDVTP